MEIKEVIEYEIPLDLTSEESIELLDQLEKKVKELKKLQEEQITEQLRGNDVIRKGKYELREVSVYKKVLDIESVDKKFVKTEVKPNMATINEYQKKNRKLPEGVTEVYWYSKIGKTDLEKKEEARKKKQEYLEKQKSKTEVGFLEGINFKSLKDRS